MKLHPEIPKEQVGEILVRQRKMLEHVSKCEKLVQSTLCNLIQCFILRKMKLKSIISVK